MSSHRYKDDAISFFSALPSRWRESRLHDIVELRTSNVDKKSEEGQNPVRLCNYVDVYKNDKVTLRLDFMEATATEAQIERFALQVGDVVITKDSEEPDDIGVPALIAETALDLVCGYHLTILRPNDEEIAGGYLFYSLASRLSAYQFYLAANGVTRFGLTYQGTKNLRIAFPPLPEQRQIAAFLDWKTGQIDALLARKRELLERLSEKRLAVITRAVTRGINPAAPLRDSGIPWLGHVPKHWEVKRLKFSVSKVGSGVTPKGGAESYEAEGVPLLRSQNVHFDGLRLDDVVFISKETHEEMSNSHVAPGDVLLNITGASIGRCSYAPEGFPDANVNQHVCIIRPNAELLTEFLHLVLWSKLGQSQIDLEQSGSGREGLNFVAIKNFMLPFPDTEEQQDIVNSTKGALAKLNELVINIETAVVRLTEYRTALITAATTGKIDVRGVKIPDSGAVA